MAARENKEDTVKNEMEVVQPMDGVQEEAEAAVKEEEDINNKKKAKYLLTIRQEVSLEDHIKRGQVLEEYAAEKAASSGHQQEAVVTPKEVAQLQKRLDHLKGGLSEREWKATQTAHPAKGNGKGKGNTRKGKRERDNAKQKTKGTEVQSPFDAKEKKVKVKVSAEDSDSDIELTFAEQNRLLNILGKSKNIVKGEDVRVGDIKDHMEEVKLLLKKVQSNIAKE